MVPLAGVSMSVYYVLHISFMWFVKFDYGYNMKVGGDTAPFSRQYADKCHCKGRTFSPNGVRLRVILR